MDSIATGAFAVSSTNRGATRSFLDNVVSHKSGWIVRDLTRLMRRSGNMRTVPRGLFSCSVCRGTVLMIILPGTRGGRGRAARQSFISGPFNHLSMQKIIPVAAAVFLCAAILCAGCTSPQSLAAVTPAPSQAAAASGTTLMPLVLTPAELPFGSTLVSSGARSPSEMSTTANDLGWQAGYVTVYSLPTNGTSGTTTVTQSLAVYSGKNISDIVTLVDANERRQTGLSFTDLPVPATGSFARAYAAVPVNAGTTSAAGNNLSLSQGTTPPVEGYKEVIFGKGSVLEVIRIAGPGADAATLDALAETAYKKLE